MPVVDTLPQLLVEGEGLVVVELVAPYSRASTFEDRRKVVQNSLD